MRTYYTIEDLEDVLRYTLCFLNEFVVPNETIITTYETNALQIWQHRV